MKNSKPAYNETVQLQKITFQSLLKVHLFKNQFPLSDQTIIITYYLKHINSGR